MATAQTEQRMNKQMSKMMVWAVVAAVVPVAAVSAQQQAAGGGVQATLTQNQYVVGRALPPDTPGAQRVDLSLEAAISRALEHNLDIAREKLNPQMQEYSLQASRAAFLPTLNGNYSYNNASAQSTSQLDGGARTTTQRNSFGTSMSQRMKWQGAQVSFNFTNSRTSTDNSFSTRNPNFSSGLSLNYQQPLLAGRTIDNQRNSLATGDIQRQITDIALVTQIENIKNQVRTAYWSLRQSIELIEIQRRSLELSRRNYDDNKTKVEVGTVAEIDLVQLESQIANGEQSLLAAEIAWRNAEIAFKRLLVSSTEDDFFRSTINPTDLPSFEMPSVDIPAAVKNAITQRADIETARQNIRISELNLALSKNGTRASLGLTASYSLAGVGGPLYSRLGLGGTAVLVEDGSYFDALRSIAGIDTPTWQVGLNFSRPLGLSSQKASHLRSELSMEQQKTALKRTELDIETAVTRAGLDVQSTYKQLLAAQKSREAAERTLNAELTRFSVGLSTNFQVISLQNALTSARNNELTATIRYINAIAEFDRVQRIA
ncbi:MAG: TolC family protein [Acidobacteria bacterium]|nr:TolC family protein [Acidobacteriota bacterium]